MRIGTLRSFAAGRSLRSLTPGAIFDDMACNWVEGHINRSLGILNLETLLSFLADKPVPLARLACLLLAKGQGERARELCAQAIAMAPCNEESHAIAAQVFGHNVPGWYFPMVRDHVRHMAFEKAMHRAIRPGCRVLEIGTGTGLLAMMAARAGAAEVVTCESNPAVAATASEIVALNGLADCVRVIAKLSADLVIRIDLAEPADVLVWDALSNNMIGAGALPTMEQAMRRLMRPGARAIPARGTVRIALAEDRKAHRSQMHMVEGFDLSAFNRLAAGSYDIAVGDERLALRSEPGDLFHFDFQSGGPFPEARAAVSLSSAGGIVNGIAQWPRLELDEEECYEKLPQGGAISAFAAMFYPIWRLIEAAPRDMVTVWGAHDRLSFRIWAEIPET
jgi:type III protein arginine methyltransferase